MSQRTIKLVFYGIFTVCLFTACHSVPEIDVSAPIPSTITILANPEAQQNIMIAFASAYPDKISAVEFINNDWSMLVNGIRFYFAGGRFLPEDLREQWADYLPYDFYDYPWTGTAKQRQAEFKNPVYSVGSSFLFDTLYASPTEDSSWDWQEKYSFLGVKMLIHSNIKPFLDRVTEQIRAAAKTDTVIDEWISELQTSPADGWNWRKIANSNRLSNHSYGIAIDLFPRDLKGRYTYWQWGAGDIETINNITYYLPPEKVIMAFEEHGFVWGGKWSLIDTMHFEYRPEILILNNIPIKR